MATLSINSLPNYPEISRVYVDADKAKQWLQKNGKNRPPGKNAVERYAQEMLRGEWRETGDTIKFNRRGLLIDGQHRLMAVIASGIGQWFMVATNVSDDSMSYIDGGKPRSMLDRLVIGGRVGTACKESVSVARSMFVSTASRRAIVASFTVSDMELVFSRYGDAIQFSIDKTSFKAGIKGVVNASLRAPVARAYYHMDHDDLSSFCEAITRGDMSMATNQTIAVLYRQIIRETQNRTYQRSDRYRRVERTLLAVKRGENLSKIYTNQGELFPLPGEETLPWNQ